ncbi:MAG: hypothetical protein CL623_01200 [Arcobacter sp.]|nr:hypothetical protein [Arcobacter sp.]|tara:strand:- start:8345 stop:9841 length:1497 start_codon:yes stop_codon:yes gene_type:complete
MTNLFKRNNTYYIRLAINDDLEIYFGYKREYIKSLKTNNINNAKVIARYLISKFNYLKRSFKMFTTKEIKEYIEEFKKINFDDIVNRNTHLSINQIDTIISDLNKEVDIYDEIIEKELYDLMQLLHLSDREDDITYGLDVEAAEVFKKYIIQIKINALNDVKKNIQNEIDTSALDQVSFTSNNSLVTIKEAFEEWLNTRDGVSEAQEHASRRDVGYFLEYCNISKIIYIQNLKHKDLISYRTYLKKLKPNGKVGALNNALTNLITFLNYCHEKAHYIPKLTKDVKFKVTTKDKIKMKRSPYSNQDYKKILEKIDLIRLSPKKQEPNKYHNEYETIIKIAAYTGAREKEICQLTKKDIKSENGILYFNFKIEIDEVDEKELKTISSFRKVPIHSELIEDLNLYLSKIRTKNLFKIKSTQFSIDFGYFKTKLGFDKTYVFHSFRHTLQNKLKQKKVQYEMINEIVGHGAEDDNKITDDYTQKYELQILKEELEKISYIDK